VVEKPAPAEHEIVDLLARRWSTRAFSNRPVDAETLLRLFEAARWAPSSVNEQPWLYLYATKDQTDLWNRILESLHDSNKVWAKNAAALVLFISRTTFEHNGEPSITHSYDTGAAWQNFALEGALRGLVVHGMEGFDYERARAELQIPAEFQVEAMAAVGKPGSPETLPEKLRQQEAPNSRRSIKQSISEGLFRW